MPSEAMSGQQSARTGFFEKRQLQRYAGIWSLWALGVGAVISGHFSGWNYGLAVAGWGGLLAAAATIAFMFLCLVFCIAEMSAALPDAGATYVFARRAMGPWGGFLSGLCDNVEYVLTPAVICFFIGSYLGSMFDSGLPDWCWWIATYGLFLVLNIRGIALSFRVTLVITLISLAILLLFCALAVPHIEVSRWALNIGADGAELAGGSGPLFPFGMQGVLAALPFAVWLYLAIEELPLAAEESVAPRRDMPRGILFALATLIGDGLPDRGDQSRAQRRRRLQARHVRRTDPRWLPGLVRKCRRHSVRPHRALGADREFSCHYLWPRASDLRLSRSGYFPAVLSTTHAGTRRPTSRCLPAPRGLAIMMTLWFVLGGKAAAPVIGSVLLNMAVFGAMLSYILRAISFIVLRRRNPRHGKALHQSVRPIRCRRRHRDLSGHAVLPVARPKFFQGRSLGHHVVRGRERLFRAPRTPSPDAEPGGSLRIAARSGAGAEAGEILNSWAPTTAELLPRRLA